MIHSDKRILLLLPEAFESAGGIQMFCRSLCLATGRWAQKNNGSVSAIVLNDQIAPDSRYVNGEFCSFIRAGGSKIKFVSSYLTQIATRKPDIIIIGHVSLSPLSLLALPLNRPAKVCVIAYGIEVWRALTFTERNALRRADRVLAISEYTRSELLKRNRLDPENVTLLPCSLDPYWIVDADPPSNSSTPPILLTVGRLMKGEAYKGVDSVIRSLPDVVREFGPVDYRIVGHGDDIPRLKDVAERLGVSQFVTFTGRLSEQELRALYRECSLFVMPSEKEGFGIVFLEAMAYGKPVIGGAHGGTFSVIDDEKTGKLVKRLDLKGLSEAISRILKDDELSSRFGRAGREKLLSMFTFQSFESNLHAFLDSHF
jgi:glycosyltransferase involved in cell wall biosynthesis